MTTPNKKDIEICYECLKKSKYKSENHLKNILGSRDVDYDIFLMLTSKQFNYEPKYIFIYTSPSS